ncbi:MAG TPA: oxygen-independent coproporphyrinogen III oxidase [Aquifex aeolicus]|nr:oxygen-independent coproporphyrinogen III oxidase [Aquificales bacterium]HIP86646.1 oxygen-independent coproporphyrinogen III oxidase [Aquifex sp.]HIQ26473.1 oxygen-independent coproporphyrinogen III oxidase [Aquifex aeolicus]
MDVVFSQELIKKYDKPGPRYTSYPPATEFNQQFGRDYFIKHLLDSNEKANPLSLYFHIPFCENACWFCGCNVVINRIRGREVPYLNRLEKEINILKRYLDFSREVVQLHWGGGTPNYLTKEQTRWLFDLIRKNFNISPKAEISVEIDPRSVDFEYLKIYRELGFNRISVGVQDFNPTVQKAVNRIQPLSLMERIISQIRQLGFGSVNIDLIYGLPYQTPESFKETVRKTLALNPDRVAVYNFAYVPWLKPLQRRIDPKTLPQPRQKLEMLKIAIEEFTSAGYVYIGMDHFAKPTDKLVLAQREGKLWRNFQGYTTKKGVDLIGIGMTSISMLEKFYGQNYKTIRPYYFALDGGVLPTFRGIELNQDDLIRREVITELICNFRLDIRQIEDKFGIDFDTYFESELEELKPMEADGLLTLSGKEIKVTPLGRLLIRNICMVFDIYTKRRRERRFSRTI